MISELSFVPTVSLGREKLAAGARRTFALTIALWLVLVGVWGVVVPAPRAEAYLPACPTMKSWTQTETFVPGAFCLATAGDQFIYQSDGNLVWYVNSRAIWSSGTAGRGQMLALQADGNVVIYDANSGPVYASSWGQSPPTYTSPDKEKFVVLTFGQGTHMLNHEMFVTSNALGASSLNLLIQDLGRDTACVHDFPSIRISGILQTVDRGELCLSNDNGTLVFQKDGNFVEYVGGAARWSSGTGGRGARLAFQSDGNVVIYNSAGSPIWAISNLTRGWEPRHLTRYTSELRLEVILTHVIVYETFDAAHPAHIFGFI